MFISCQAVCKTKQKELRLADIYCCCRESSGLRCLDCARGGDERYHELAALGLGEVVHAKELGAKSLPNGLCFHRFLCLL